MNPDQVRAYLDANPQIRDSTAQWLQQQGEQRDVYTWVLADITENPQSVHRQQYDAWQAGGAGAITPDLPADQLDSLIAAANAGDQQAAAALDAAGYELASDTEELPIEQGVLQTALPGLIQDIEGDAGRRSLVDTLSGQATADYNVARDALSPEENARRLTEELAQADTTSGRLSGSAGTAAAEQLAALQASIAAMQQSLTGDLAAKAAALQQQVAAFTANLGTFDATQKAALAEQITAQQQNLEAAITAQRSSLAQELQTLRGGVDTRTEAQRAALDQELASLRDVNTAEANARKAALQQEIASLRTASTAENQARTLALQQEIDGLTAAQAPMAQARLDSANALSTAVNLGLQSTNDQLTAQRAKQGYIGSSSFSDAAQARAAIGARQTAAGVMGGAREANAGDIRAIEARRATEGRMLADTLAGRNLDISGREATEGRSLSDWEAANESSIGVRGATGTRGISDNAAGAMFDITSRGATGSRSLADILADGTRSIGDAGAAGTAAIKATTGAGQMGVDNAGAGQSYQDKVVGSNELKSLLDALAQGNAGIAVARAAEQKVARDSGTMARQGYFDNAYTRGLGGTLARPGLAADLSRTLTTLGDYGNTGLNRSISSLNWWGTNPGTPPVGAYVPAQVDNAGNDISGLGAALVGTAANLGNANNWWQKPKVATPATGYTTPAGNVGVQTDWSNAWT